MAGAMFEIFHVRMVCAWNYFLKSTRMRKKIEFIRRKSGRIAGVLARCTHTHKIKGTCTRPEHHTQNHAYKEITTKQLPGKKLRYISQATKLSCLEMIEDPAYRRKLLGDLRKRKLRPAVECMLWYYAKGKPKEMVEHSGTLTLQEELASLSADELRARALDVAKMLTTSPAPPTPTSRLH